MENYMEYWGSETAEYAAFESTFEEQPPFSNQQRFKNPFFRNSDGYVLDKVFLRGIFEIKSVQVKPDDVFVCSFPKSGTTWLQEIVFAIHSDLDFERAKTSSLSERFPFLDIQPITLSSERPNLIMTHHSYPCLPKSIVDNECKILYIARNPKDVLVSFYYFYKMNTRVNFTGDFKEFFKMFLSGDVLFSPYARHVLGFWQRRHQPNIHFVTYEALQKDTIIELRKIAQFLGKSLSDEQLHQVAVHCSMGNMVNTPSMNYSNLFQAGVYNAERGTFLRKGQIGDWKNHLDDKMNETMNQWITNNFAYTDMKFEYE